MLSFVPFFSRSIVEQHLCARLVKAERNIKNEKQHETQATTESSNLRTQSICALDKEPNVHIKFPHYPSGEVKYCDFFSLFPICVQTVNNNIFGWRLDFIHGFVSFFCMNNEINEEKERREKDIIYLIA